MLRVSCRNFDEKLIENFYFQLNKNSKFSFVMSSRRKGFLVLILAYLLVLVYLYLKPIVKTSRNDRVAQFPECLPQVFTNRNLSISSILILNNLN